jgi:DNA-binding GntR family transcriptional regulator
MAPPAACRHRGQGTGGAQILRVAQYSRNPMLTELLCAELYPLLRLYRGLPVDALPRTRRAVVEHERVVSAIENRDPDLAEIMMRRHIAAARARRQAVLAGTGTPKVVSVSDPP